MEEIVLDDGRLSAGIVPDLGAGLTHFARMTNGGGQCEILRATAVDAVRAPTDLACFLMAPYCNRIGDAQFTFDGRPVSLTRNFAPEPHAIHGAVWRARFDVVGTSATSAGFRHNHAADDHWPWAMVCDVDYRLANAALHITLGVTNTSDDAFPAGLGIHPYFPRPNTARIQTRARAVIATDRRGLPTTDDTDHGALGKLKAGQPLPRGLDNQLSGWSGEAQIAWSDHGDTARLWSEPRLNWAQVFTPADADFFCFEPVSHRVNAHNTPSLGLPATGLRVLCPGETYSVRFVLEVASLAP